MVESRNSRRQFSVSTILAFKNLTRTCNWLSTNKDPHIRLHTKEIHDEVITGLFAATECWMQASNLWHRHLVIRGPVNKRNGPSTRTKHLIELHFKNPSSKSGLMGLEYECTVTKLGHSDSYIHVDGESLLKNLSKIMHIKMATWTHIKSNDLDKPWSFHKTTWVQANFI